MSLDRRSFLGGLAGIFASGFAPAAIGSSVLMPVRKIISPISLMTIHGVVGAGLCIGDLIVIEGKRFMVTGAIGSGSHMLQVQPW